MIIDKVAIEIVDSNDYARILEIKKLLKEIYIDELGWQPGNDNASQIRVEADEQGPYLEDRFSDDPHIIWIAAIYQNKVVGCVRYIRPDNDNQHETETYNSLVKNMLEERGKSIEINRIALERNFRGIGVIEKMLAKVFEDVLKDENEGERFSLFCATAHAALGRIFEKIEFPIIEDLKFKYEAHDQDEVAVYFVSHQHAVSTTKSKLKEEVIHKKYYGVEKETGWTAYHRAVYEGALDDIDELIARQVHLPENSDKKGYLPYQIGPYQTTSVEYHLRYKQALAKVNPNYIENAEISNAWSALHRAVYEANVDRIKWLIANGAKVVKDAEGRFPHQVTTYGPLANDSNYQVRRQEVERLVNPHYVETFDYAKSHNKWTALHRAVYQADVNRVKWLIANGAKIAEDAEGRFPHQVTTYTSDPNYQIRRQEVERLVNPHYIETDHKNWTALHRAIYEADVERVKWLIINGSKVLKDNDGHYPHQIACYPTFFNNNRRKKDYEIAKQLVEGSFATQTNICI